MILFLPAERLFALLHSIRDRICHVFQLTLDIPDTVLNVSTEQADGVLVALFAFLIFLQHPENR